MCFRSPILPFWSFYSNRTGRSLIGDLWQNLQYRVCTSTFHGYNKHKNYGCYFSFIVLFLKLKVVIKHWDFKSRFFLPIQAYLSKDLRTTSQNLICLWVTEKLKYSQNTLILSMCSLCPSTLFINRMLSLRNAANAQTDDRFSYDQECRIRGLRWQKETNDPDRPAHQRRNGSGTPQWEGRHQDPEVYTTPVYIAIKSSNTFPLCYSCSAIPSTGRSRIAIYCNSWHTHWLCVI